MVLQTQSILVRLAYLIVVVQIKIVTTSSMEYTTSIAVMTKLLMMEKDLIENLSDYAKLMQGKMDTINLALSTLRLEHSKQTEDPEEFLSNPLNSFALMRRMHLDWNKYHEYMNESVGQDKIDFFESFGDKLPNADDYTEAQTGFYRLQETYQINENDMARGFLFGTQYDVKLSVLECFAMGKYSNNRNSKDKSLRWFKVALKYYDESYVNLYTILGVTLADIWYMIAELSLDISGSLDAINRALALRPDDEIFKAFKKSLINYLNHDRLCNERKMPTGKHLHCRYNSETHPFFKLGPLKMEEISIDPFMAIYHNFMHDKEMQELRNTPIPYMQQGIVDEDVDASLGRTAFNFKVYDNTSNTVNSVSKRIDILTGLDPENYEMAVFNYAIGGYHYCHNDHYENAENIHPLTGNRKLVVLMYLEDNLDGGTVVFPLLDIAVPPKKGLALVFPTVDNEGNPEERTMHASCPVIFGSKWAFIKIYQEFPQMFKLPCYERNK